MSAEFCSFDLQRITFKEVLIQLYVEGPYLNFVYTHIALHRRVTITKPNKVIASLEKKISVFKAVMKRHCLS